VWILSGTQQKLTLIRRRGVAFDEAASVFFDPLAVSGSEPDHSAQSPFFCMNDEWHHDGKSLSRLRQTHNESLLRWSVIFASGIQIN
jgi:hypothetical protein